MANFHSSYFEDAIQSAIFIRKPALSRAFTISEPVEMSKFTSVALSTAAPRQFSLKSHQELLQHLLLSKIHNDCVLTN